MGLSYRQRTYHGACLKTAIQGCGRQLDKRAFHLMAEVSFRVLISPAKRKKKRDLRLAGKVGGLEVKKLLYDKPVCKEHHFQGDCRRLALVFQ